MTGSSHVRALEYRPVAKRSVSSTGALIAAAYLGGRLIDERTTRAESLKWRELIRVNRSGRLLDRMRSPAITSRGRCGAVQWRKIETSHKAYVRLASWSGHLPMVARARVAH